MVIVSSENPACRREHRAAGQRRDVLELVQPPVAEPWGRGPPRTGKMPLTWLCTSMDSAVPSTVLRDDHQRPRRPHDLVEQRHELLDLGDLLAAQQDVRVVEHRLKADAGEVTRYGDR